MLYRISGVSFHDSAERSVQKQCRNSKSGSFSIFSINESADQAMKINELLKGKYDVIDGVIIKFCLFNFAILTHKIGKIGPNLIEIKT